MKIKRNIVLLFFAIGLLLQPVQIAGKFSFNENVDQQPDLYLATFPVLSFRKIPSVSASVYGVQIKRQVSPILSNIEAVGSAMVPSPSLKQAALAEFSTRCRG